jgi:hypothetical protein
MAATDRQIVERLLIPAMMQTVILGLQQTLGEDADILTPVNSLLSEALREPVAAIDPGRVAKLLRRAKRVCTQAVVTLSDKVVGVQYLAVARLTADLAERDIIVVGADSPFAKAWDLMAEVMELSWDVLEPLDSEATGVARDLRQILESEGFYRA